MGKGEFGDVGAFGLRMGREDGAVRLVVHTYSGSIVYLTGNHINPCTYFASHAMTVL